MFFPCKKQINKITDQKNLQWLTILFHKIYQNMCQTP